MKVSLIFMLMVFPLLATAQIIPVLKQGITGKVYLQQGNSMPVPGRKTGNGVAVSRNVYVYELTTTAQTTQQATFFTAIKTKLIAKTQSGANGNYSIALPPGDYSVFVEQGNRMYANNFDGNGNICPAKVKKDSVSSKDIVINDRAVN